MAKATRKKSDPKLRFLASISNITTSGCIEWSQAKMRGNYGRIYINEKVMSAHRASYILWIGPIPKNMFVCHACDNPRCVNPNHLFVGTCTDNLTDMVKKGRHFEQQKTHCPYGHEYNNINTYYESKPSGRKSRRCRTCNRLKYHKYKYGIPIENHT